MWLTLSFTYYDQFPFIKNIEKYRNKDHYIHFTQMQKVGINPRKRHYDPYGVYAYPIDFLFSETPALKQGRQYATTLPYYYILKKANGTQGWKLWDLDWNKVRELGKQNGWLQYFTIIHGKFALDQSKLPKEAFSSYYEKEINSQTNQYLLYNGLNTLDQYKVMPFTKSLKGLDWIEDNLGIINANEPKQILFLGVGSYTIVDSGHTNRDLVEYKKENKKDTETVQAYKRASKINRLQHEFKEFLKQVQWTYNSKIDYKTKSISFHYKNAEVNLQLSNARYSGKDYYLSINTLIDNHEGHSSIKEDEFYKYEVKELLKLLENRINEAITKSRPPEELKGDLRLAETLVHSYVSWKHTVQYSKWDSQDKRELNIRAAKKQEIKINGHDYIVNANLGCKVEKSDKLPTLAVYFNVQITCAQHYGTIHFIMKTDEVELPKNAQASKVPLQWMLNSSLDWSIQKLAKYRPEEEAKSIFNQFVLICIKGLDVGPKLYKECQKLLPVGQQLNEDRVEPSIFLDVFLM